MAAPTPDTSTEVAGSSTPGTQAYTITLPSLTAGDLIVVMANRYTDPLTTSDTGWSVTNWNEPVQSQRLHWFHKISDGTETVLNVSGGGSHNAKREQHIALRITGVPASGYQFIASAASGTSTTPNPPNCDPASGSQDFLWLAPMLCDGRAAYSSAPSGYTLVANVNGSSFENATLALAYLQSTASTEDPGTYGISGSRGWVAQTIAVFPAPAATGRSPVINAQQAVHRAAHW